MLVPTRELAQQVERECAKLTFHGKDQDQDGGGDDELAEYRNAGSCRHSGDRPGSDEGDASCEGSMAAGKRAWTATEAGARSTDPPSGAR